MNAKEAGPLALLPDTFRFFEALERISERQFRRLVAEGQRTSPPVLNAVIAFADPILTQPSTTSGSWTPTQWTWS